MGDDEDAAKDRGREEGGAVIGPEKSDEEHHFGTDEQRHPIMQPVLHRRRVGFFSESLMNNVAPPQKHNGKNAHKPDHRSCDAGVDRQAAERDFILVHIHHHEPHHDARRQRAEERPYRRAHEMPWLRDAAVFVTGDIVMIVVHGRLSGAGVVVVGEGICIGAAVFARLWSLSRKKV